MYVTDGKGRIVDLKEADTTSSLILKRIKPEQEWTQLFSSLLNLLKRLTGG